MPRRFRSKNLSVSLAPTGRLAEIAEKLRICVLHTHICLGWTNCRLCTHYCEAWISWCRLFTLQQCGRVTFRQCDFDTLIRCQIRTLGPICRPETIDPGCGPASPIVDPGDIVVDPEIYVRQVAELKADLREALTQLEAHEKEIAGVAKARD
jgi:hypothetical protein